MGKPLKTSEAGAAAGIGEMQEDEVEGVEVEKCSSCKESDAVPDRGECLVRCDSSCGSSPSQQSPLFAMTRLLVGVMKKCEIEAGYMAEDQKSERPCYVAGGSRWSGGSQIFSEGLTKAGCDVTCESEAVKGIESSTTLRKFIP
jgi:hypothetical protein